MTPRIVPDDTYPAMFRIHWPDGIVSDMANITRCRDAVRCFVKTSHDEQQRRRKAGKADVPRF